MYYLKLFDETLLTFDMNNDMGLEISNIQEISQNRNIYPALLKDEITPQTLEGFLKTRVIPKNRWFVEEILKTIGVNKNDIKGIIDICKGLSLNDCYWITDNEDLKFNNYNLYDNEFSETLSLVAFTGYTSKIKGIITSPEFTTSGMLPKAWRRINNKVYLYKGSTEMWKASNTGNEPYSEYYASQIAKTLGINAIEYDLEKWKNILVSTCEIFTSKQYSYVPMGYIIPTGGLKSTSEFIIQNGFKEKFADMIMFDALIYNPDRHFGNFGMMRDNKTGEYVDFAPIFDNGDGLLSKGDVGAFENFETLKEYVKTPDVDTSYYGVNFEKLVATFCGKLQIAKLRKLLTFELQPHARYNLSEKRLKLLSLLIQYRAKELIEVIEKSEK